MPNFKDLKVLYVGSPPLFGKGASSIHMLSMCEAMTSLGIKVELVLPGNFTKERLFKYYDVTNDFAVKNIPYTDKFARQITHGIASAIYANSNRKQFEVVLTRNILFTYVAVSLLGLPVIYDAHHPPVNKAAELLIRSFINSPAFRGMSFNSTGLFEIYSKKGLVSDSSVVAHNGVKLRKFNSVKDKLQLRKELGLPLETKIVTYSGNTYSGRGIEHLLDVAKNMQEIMFLVVGGTEKDNEIYIRTVNENGINNVIIKGFVEHGKVAEYLLASDILVMPYSSNVTIRDGKDASAFTSPIKLFEYMAAGKPVVATSIPSVMEILKNGYNSLVVNPGNKKDLENALRQLIDDESKASGIAKNAKEDVQNYTWEKRVENILNGLNIAAKIA